MPIAPFNASSSRASHGAQIAAINYFKKIITKIIISTEDFPIYVYTFEIVATFEVWVLSIVYWVITIISEFQIARLSKYDDPRR